MLLGLRFFRNLTNFSQKIINLSLHRPYHHFRIQQSRRAYDLLCTQKLMGAFIIRRGR